MELLNRAQEELGLSRSDLCRMLGLPSGRPQTIRDWEAGRRQMDDARRRLLEAYLAGYRPDDWPVREGGGAPLVMGFRAFYGDVEIEDVVEVHEWVAIDLHERTHPIDRVILTDGRVITKPEGDAAPRSILADPKDAGQ